MNSNKGISPVVATTLLLVVTVVSVVGFISWYSSYSSSILADTETNSKSSDLAFKGIVDNNIYIGSNSNQNIKILNIMDNNGNMLCKYNSNNLTLNISSYEILNLGFEEKNSTHVFDSSPYASSGLIENALINSNNCIIGKCMQGLGNSSKINFGDLATLKTDSVTLAAWFSLDQISTQTEQQNIFHESHHLNRIFLPGSPQNNILRFYEQNSTNNINIDSLSLLNISQYYFVVGTYDQNKMKLYLDNIKQSEGNLSGPITHGLQDFKIGSVDDEFFKGYMDEVKIYSKALNSNEINNLYYFNTPLINISSGINKIAIPGCKLKKGEIYNILILSDSTKLDFNFYYD